MNFIGKWEFSCLILNLIIYRIFTSAPRLFVVGSGTGAPAAALCASLISVFVIWLMLLIYKKCGCLSLPQLAAKYMGNFGRWVVSLALILYLLLSAFYALGDFSLLVKQIAFPAAPLWYICIFFVIAAIFASLRGFNAVMRTHVVFVPIAILLTVIVFMSVFRYAQWDNLFPLPGRGLMPLVRDSIRGTFLFSDIILLFAINPPDRIKDSTLAAAGGGLIIILLVTIFTLTSAYPQSTLAELPIYQLLKMVYYGRFFQRIDAIYMLCAALCGMLYLSFTFYLTAKLIGDLQKDRGKQL